MMKTILGLALGVVLGLGFRLEAAESSLFDDATREAESFYKEGSYAKAREAYQKLGKEKLTGTQKRWVDFRVADTEWRAQAATSTADNTKLEEARHQLEVLNRDRTRVEQHDKIWAEVEESLADNFWTRRNNQNWGEAWPHYQAALDWWAGAPEVDAARDRYLGIIWKMSRPPHVEPYYTYGYYGNYVSLEILQNGLKIAQTKEDKARLHFMVAMTLRNQGGDWDQRARVPEEFEAALKEGRKTDWYDDALANYAEWMMSYGRITLREDGGWSQEPDYKKALELYQRLVREFAKGETRYWEQAQNQIKNITEPQVGVSLQSLFLPDSEIQYALSWRNVDRVELTLYPVELNRDVKLSEGKDWLQSIEIGNLEKLKSWKRQAKNAGDYKPGNEMVVLDEKLKPGAYLLEARAGGKSARDLILVTDATLITKTSGKKALLFLCNALNCEPLGGAKFKVIERWYDNQHWQIRSYEKTAQNDGTALFELETRAGNSREIFASAILKDRQAFALGNSYWQSQGQDSWKIYAFTDRPAYRPKETVQWKFIARSYDGAHYSTPANQKIVYRIDDPRGAKVSEETATLNSFGSAWGSLDLTETMPLGEYRVTFWDEGKHRQIGSATLYRLEEYKLPEFKVTVQTPEEESGPGLPKRKKAFRVGEKVEVDIQADYYFGGGVANATVEVLVHQNPFYHWWHPAREFPWFYEDTEPSMRWGRSYGGGQVIKRETLKTDAAGKATLTFETPANSGQDYEYRVEARVTDASRREIVGNGTVRVTRQRYYVYLRPGHNLYHPQDKVAVDIKALDANEQPVQTEGIVKVTRDVWYEVWISPEGREVKGEELRKLRTTTAIFPPPPTPDENGWRLKASGYEHEDIFTRSLKTDTNGAAQLTFTPEREGYYRVAWTSTDPVPNTKRASPVRGETAVWVAERGTRELGYHTGGLEIVVDKDTFRVGEKAPVMLVTQSNDRNVLFTVEGEDLYSYQVVHLDGTVKLIELPITEDHVPNITLGAALAAGRQVFMDSKSVVVPPTKNFLTVDVEPDKTVHEPRENGTFTITARDDRGKPVSAEIAFSLVDQSVFYIQQDYAGDPRQFFFGSRRNHSVQTQSTLNYRQFEKLVRDEEGKLKSEWFAEGLKKDGRYYYNYDGLERKQAGEADFYSRDRSFGTLSDETLSASGGRPMFAAKAMRLAGAASNLAPGAPVAQSLALFNGREDLAKLSPAEPEAPVEVRSDFRSTIVWQPDVKTDANGRASIKVTYPDSLTTWKAQVRAVTAGNQFGIAETNAVTRQPLMVRLQAPRFFVVGDKVTLSALVNNDTDKEEAAVVTLEFTGGLNLQENKPVRVRVPAHGEARADWLATVASVGEVKLKVTARAGKHADAMERTYSAYEHGIEKFISKSGKSRADDVTIRFELPSERKAGSTEMTVQVAPSLAVTMLDALPYLIDYPYGCTEQTMSRFLPTVITARTLKQLGLAPEDVAGRIFGGIETAHAMATHSRGKQDLEKIDGMVKAGLERLYDFQHSDGGWGWWKQGESDHWMTAYVVWGLTLGHDADVQVRQDVLNKGVGYLEKTLVEEEQSYDMQAWMLHALAVNHTSFKKKDVTKFEQKAFDNLWSNKDALNAYSRALFALAAQSLGKTEQAKILVENLQNGVKRDERPDESVLLGNQTQKPADTSLGTAHWGEDGIYWRWSEGGVEATAFALRALLAIDPQSKLIEPATNWLIKNRRGAQWNSTRDTAIVVLAMNDYLRASGELSNEMEYELIVNGTSVARKKLAKSDLLSAPSRFQIAPELVKDANDIRIRRKSGTGAVYFAAEAKFFSLEEPIKAVGNEIFVRREYSKLVGHPTLLKGYVYDKAPLRDGDSVRSGERIETMLTIEAKNNYEYLVFEDLKPAGFEMVEARSGESVYARELKSGAVQRQFKTNTTAAASGAKASAKAARVRGAATMPRIPDPNVSDENHTGRQRWVYQELRDRKVALFIDKLPEGVWEIRYDARAEVPGEFHALPVSGYAMYVPEIRCNGNELRVKVLESADR